LTFGSIKCQLKQLLRRDDDGV